MANLTVPVYEAQQGLSPQANVNPIPPGTGQQESQGIEAAGQALSRLGLAVGELDRYRAMQDARLQASKSIGALYGTVSNLGYQFSQDPDISTAAQRFDTATDAAFKEATKGITDPALLSDIGNSYQRLKAAQGLDLRKALQQRREDQAVADLDTLTNEYAHQAATAGSDAEFQAVEKQTNDTIDSAAALGLIKPQDAVKRKQQFVELRSALRVEQLGQSDPAGMVKSLADPSFMPDLSPDKRQALSEHMATLANSQATRALASEERAARLQDRAQKKVYAATAKDGDDLLANGQLTADWIQAHKEDLDPSDYRHFHDKLLSGPTEHTDVDTYMSLLDRATKATEPGDLDAVNADARQALRGNRIKLDDFNRISSITNQRSAGHDLPSWQKQGTDYIRDTLGPAGLFDVDPAAAKNRMANATNDFNDWAALNPQATRADAEKEYKGLVQSYATTDYSKNATTMPAPTYLVGDRAEPNIEATASATKMAFLAKHNNSMAAMLADPDFQAQVQLIQRWKALVAQQKAAEAKP